MSSDRRTFLQRLTLGSVAFGALPASLRAEQPAPAASAPEEFNEFAGLDEQSAAQPAAQTFDVSWTQKLTGKHRAVFDVPAIVGGAGVMRAALWVNHYKSVLKAATSDISPVIVIRHAGIALLMSNTFWEEYDIGKKEKVRHPVTDKKLARNPVLLTVEDDQISAGSANNALHKQIERGVVVLGCDMAFAQIVRIVAKQDKLPNPEARAKAVTMIVPGVIMQPNGIFGVTLAQQNGCVYVQAT